MTHQSSTIYLAEDDEDDCLFFLEAVKEIDPQLDVVVCRDGVELMENLHINVPPIPRVIFLDLNMPRKNVLDCLVEIKQTEKLKDIPIVIVSTSSASEHLNRTYSLGANCYMTKPPSQSQLAEGIEKILKRDFSRSKHTSLDEFLLGSIMV